MRILKIRYLIILFYSTFLFSLIIPECNAKIVVFTFEEKVVKADIILIGKVVKTNKKLFGYDIAIIKPERVIKGKLESDQIKIKFGNVIFTAKEDLTTFEVGATYVLFLNKDRSEYWLTAAHHGYYKVNNGKFVSFDRENIRIADFVKKIDAVLQTN